MTVLPWQALYFFPEPQKHGWLRPGRFAVFSCVLDVEVASPDSSGAEYDRFSCSLPPPEPCVSPGAEHPVRTRAASAPSARVPRAADRLVRGAVMGVVPLLELPATAVENQCHEVGREHIMNDSHLDT